MDNLPKDPIILLSYINTKLRDDYPTLDALCEGLNIDSKDLSQKLKNVGYEYSPEHNRFI